MDVASSDERVIATARAYESSARSWLDGHGTDRSAWQNTYTGFTKLVAPGGLVLDLGCGGGLDVPAFDQAKLRAVGFDISSSMLTAARNQASLNGRTVLGDLRLLPFADTSFDGVWADGSLHHVVRTEMLSALKEVSRVLKAGGGFMASVERGDGEGYRVELDNIAAARWYAYYEPDEWRALLRKSGFEMVDALMGGVSESNPYGFFAMFARKL